MATLAGTAYVRVAYDPASIQSMRRSVAAEGQKAGTSFASSFAKSGPALTRVGHTLTRSLTLPIGLAAAAATKYTYDFSQSLNHISALVGVGSKQMDQYRSSILKLAPAVGQGPTALADALYFITSSGYKGAGALKVLEASAKGAASGLGDTKTIADLVTSAVTVYGEKNLSAAHAVDILTQAVRDGKGEPDQYATAMGRLIPVSNNMGVSFDQAAAAVASLTLAGFSVDKAVTGMASVFTNLSKPTTTGAKALDKVGLSYAGLQREIKDKGLLPALLTLNKAFDGNGVALRQVFSSGKAIVPFLALTGQAAGRTAKVFGDLSNSTGAADKAFQAQSKTTAFQVQKAMAQIQVSAVSLGGVLLPIFANIIGKLAVVAQAFANLPPGMQEVVIGAAAVAFSLGPVLTVIGNVAKVTGLLSKAFTSAAPAMARAAPAAQSAAAGISGFTASAAGAEGATAGMALGILGPVGIVAALAVGVGALVYFSNNTSAVDQAMQDATKSANNFATALEGIPGAKLGVAQAKLTQKVDVSASVAAQKRVNDLVRAGKKGTDEYRAAVIAADQAELTAKASKLGVAAAQGQLNDAQQKAQAGRRAELTSLDHIAEVSRKVTTFTQHLTNRMGSQVDVTRKIQTTSEKAAAATAKYSTLTRALAGTLETAARKAGGMATQAGAAQTKTAAFALAAHDLSDKLGRVPTHKEINVYFKNNMAALIRQALDLGGAISAIPIEKNVTIRTYHTQGGTAQGKGHAAGGPVLAGVTYPVGERGAELFTPNVDGTIIPHDKINAGGGWGDTYVYIGNEAVDSHLIRVVRSENRETARAIRAGRRVVA